MLKMMIRYELLFTLQGGMRNIISDIAEQFYDKIISNHYFSSFFIDRDFEEIKVKVKEYIYEQLIIQPHEINHQNAYRLGVLHSDIGIPLNNIMSFLEYIQKHARELSLDGIFKEEGLMPENLSVISNHFAHGYLHNTIKSTDIISVPQFSVFSTTRVATAVISWIQHIHTSIITDNADLGTTPDGASCDLFTFLDKPYFNMIFECQNNIFDFNKMHLEMHSTAKSLLYFIERSNYIQAYYVYNDFIDQCKTFMNFYFERVVLFEQNNENYFYKFVSQKADNNRNITLFTFNIRNMSIINKVWGYANGDYIVNEVERKIDRRHGMNSDKSAFIKTKNAEFIVVLLDTDFDTAQKEFNELVKILTSLSPARGEFISDMRVSSAFLPLGNSASQFMSLHLPQLTAQAIEYSKKNENIPVICSDDIITEFMAHIKHDEQIKHFIRQSFNKDNFKPYYHMIVDADDENTSHYEVLARVCDGDNCISAASFIDYLVKTERIVELDKVMLGKIAADLDKVAKKAGRIFINLSPKSLRSASYVNTLEKFIKQTAEKGVDVVFEITEQSLFDNIEIVKDLHGRYGSVFAIDDFGSGYSNFGIVSDLAQDGLVKYLKIDGSLITDISCNIYKENIVAGIIRIAESLSLNTVAEFVTNRETADKLRSLGISHMQGFYFHIPSPLNEL
jgi:EAL domain-containing protein (putative c-di-GMP-specific phosphodiesterase class I)/GGDEF domain-containing protein/truncated hemoglobin YjbI